MQPSPNPKRRPRAPRAGRLLAVDAWIDSSLYEAGFRLSQGWESATIFFRRFRVSGWRRLARRSWLWSFAVAFVLRFGYILIAHTYKIKGLEDNFAFGWEMGRIARAITRRSASA